MYKLFTNFKTIRTHVHSTRHKHSRLSNVVTSLCVYKYISLDMLKKAGWDESVHSVARMQGHFHKENVPVKVDTLVFENLALYPLIATCIPQLNGLYKPWLISRPTWYALSPLVWVWVLETTKIWHFREQ